MINYREIVEVCSTNYAASVSILQISLEIRLKATTAEDAPKGRTSQINPYAFPSEGDFRVTTTLLLLEGDIAYCLYALLRSTVFDTIHAPLPRDHPLCSAPSNNVPSLSLTQTLPECQRNSAKVIVHQATCSSVLRSIFSCAAKAPFVAFSEKSSITRSFPDC